MTMSASATKCSPPPAHTPLTAAITGFHTSLCHDGEAQLEPLRAAGLLAQRVGIAGELGHVEPGLERVARTGVDDHADVGVVVELAPRPFELVHHPGVHRVRRLRDGRRRASRPGPRRSTRSVSNPVGVPGFGLGHAHRAFVGGKLSA